MHIGEQRTYRLLAALVAMAVVVALVLAMDHFGSLHPASAGNPNACDPQPTPGAGGDFVFEVSAAKDSLGAGDADAVCFIIVGSGGSISVPATVRVSPAGCPDSPMVAPGGSLIHVAWGTKCITTGDTVTVTARAGFMPTAATAQWLNGGNQVLESPGTVSQTNEGSLAGVSDVVIGLAGSAVNNGRGLFYCILKTDHESTNNAITTYLQCNIDLVGAGVAPISGVPPSWGDTCETLAAREPPECLIGVGVSNNQLNNPSETGADALAGPPPPPPYTNLAPSIGRGFYYPGGAGAPGGICGTTDCTVVTSCFEDTGPATSGTGPNIISTATILNPKGSVTVMADTDGDTVKDTQVDRVSSGSVDIWYNQNIDSCEALTPKGDPEFLGLLLETIQVNDKGGTNVNPNPAPWRPSTNPGATTVDFDGDGCTDEQELDPKAAGKCGDDPQNPSDSFADPAAVDLSGIYGILMRAVRGDCEDDQCTENDPGVYFFCRADLQHDQPSNDIVLRTYCYADGVDFEINTEAYPGVTGDGMAGAPPPGPQDPAGSLNFAYGDVDTKHSELTGSFNKVTNMLEISGCFTDEDGADAIGNVWIDLDISAHQLPGNADIWTFQPDECEGSPVGDPFFENVDLSFWKANPTKGKGYDQDNDGVPTERELQDDSACGRRDPYNKNDYYDVSIPRDGVIDLANDILGVILHFAPGGYDPGDENWDRPQAMVGRGAGSTWNRGSPDGVIDLANDILGVILQFNPGGCPALS